MLNNYQFLKLERWNNVNTLVIVFTKTTIIIDLIKI